MKAVIIPEVGTLSVQDIPALPEPGEYECLCQNLFASSCSGTDLKLIHNHTPWKNTYPSVLGHETVGRVVRVGRSVRHFREGDIVLRPVYVYPGKIRNGLGAAFGGFSEYGMITDSMSMGADGMGSIPDYAKYQMSVPKNWAGDPSAVMFITLKETYSWMRGLGDLEAKDIGIIGNGAVALFFVKLAGLFGAKSISILSRSGAWFEKAEALGAERLIRLSETQDPKPLFDFLIDAAGILSQLDKFIPWIKPGGTMGVYGLYQTFEASFTGFGSGLHFAFHNPDESSREIHEACLALVRRKLVRLADFHSSVMDFEKAPEAYELIREKKELKTVFRFKE
ncbi:MAG: alcohol dehydrogenase catalytic domain-containing protein [Spirochaetia bacterium]|nr:alcohol dehydrogenase catalytic domain-containing protein [Spirochaetia bacterium]